MNIQEKPLNLQVTVKDSNGQVISTQNYNIIYSSNKKVGNGTVKIVFKGNYSGTITKNI